MTCPFFLQKTGGYYYGFRCELFDQGNSIVYVVDGGKRVSRIDRKESFDKEQRDEYVAEKCKGDPNKCLHYQREMKRYDEGSHGNDSSG